MSHKPTISELAAEESRRQNSVINLIASENFVSDEVKAVLGSDLTNKYAEGQPGWRYYGGVEIVDKIENRVKELAQEVFNTNYHVNVQPYSGSIANLAVYFGFLQPHDPIMGLELSHGGHLTHGHPVTISGKLYDRYAYFVNEKTGLLDYDQLESEANEVRPKLIISGASAYSREIDFKRISEIAHTVGALHLADISHISGLIATELHQSPFGYADFVMTTTHKILRGPRGAILFCKPEHAKKIDKAVFPGLQGGPHMNAIAAIGVALEEALLPAYKTYCQQVVANAQILAELLTKKDIKIVTGGTDNHLFLVDLRPQGITGAIAQQRLEEVGIIVNKNSIPYDDTPPQDPSGIRIGTCAITTKGITNQELEKLAEKIVSVLA